MLNCFKVGKVNAEKAPVNFYGGEGFLSIGTNCKNSFKGSNFLMKNL